MKQYYKLIFWINIFTDKVLDKKRIKELKEEIKNLEYYLSVEGKTYTFIELKRMQTIIKFKRNELEKLKILTGLK